MILKYACTKRAQLCTCSLGKMFVDINKIFCWSKVHRIWSDRCLEVFCLNCAVMTATVTVVADQTLNFQCHYTQLTHRYTGKPTSYPEQVYLHMQNKVSVAFRHIN